MKNLLNRLLNLEKTLAPIDKGFAFGRQPEEQLVDALEKFNSECGVNFTLQEVRKWERIDLGETEMIVSPNWRIEDALLKFSIDEERL
ncbi:hypothetical protein KKA09_04385 [Patescibacteria group bacterium]|nr:hypothetical protein [Patescibacteria group bacterium]MBU2579321.1 hypothetical protein [Patescibacteria group bacterium]